MYFVHFSAIYCSRLALAGLAKRKISKTLNLTKLDKTPDDRSFHIRIQEACYQWLSSLSEGSPKFPEGSRLLNQLWFSPLTVSVFAHEALLEAVQCPIGQVTCEFQNIFGAR